MRTDSTERPSKECQREHVIEMAKKMFAERGIRKVRMDDVALALSMSKRTIYEMFTDKEHLLLECIKHAQAQKHEYAREVAANAENVLEIVMRLYIQGIAEIKNIAPRYFDEMRKYPAVCDYLKSRKRQDATKTKAFYEQGIAQGIFRPEINYDIFQHLMNLALEGYMNSVQLEDWPMAEVLETVVRVNMRGICTEKGERLLDDFLEKINK